MSGRGPSFGMFLRILCIILHKFYVERICKRMKNRNLRDAKNAKHNEFYPQLCDIEAELQHRKEQLIIKKNSKSTKVGPTPL